MQSLFFGTYEHQLDDKHRLRIPARFKKALVGEAGEKSYSFARGKDNCIYVFPDSVLEEILEKVASEKLGAASTASLLFCSSISPAEEDSQGRVVLPAMLRSLAGIKKDIVTVGRGNRLEIYSAEHYKKLTEALDYDALFSTLGI